MSPTAPLSAGLFFTAMSPAFSALNSIPVLLRSAPMLSSPRGSWWSRGVGLAAPPVTRPARSAAPQGLVPSAVVGHVEIGMTNTNHILKVRLPYVPC